jgi:hypothetical protein
LQAEHLVAQTNQAQAATGMDIARAGYLTSAASAKTATRPTGKMQVDMDGHPWQEVFDPASGQLHFVNPVTQEPATPDVELQFRQGGSAGNPNSDFTTSGLTRMALTGTPEQKAAAKQGLALQAQAAGAAAGARTAADQAVTQPVKEQDSFLNDELKRVGGIAPKIPTTKDIDSKYKDDIDYILSPAGTIQREQSDAQNKRAAFDQQVSQYQASGVWKQKIGFQTWQQNPDLAQSQAETKAAAAAHATKLGKTTNANAPAPAGKTWNPSTGRYE